MRTKALLFAAALAAGAATSMAQSNVYSLNVVGYANVTVPGTGSKFYMIANPLNTTNNNISHVLASAQDGDQFYKYNGGYTTYTYDGLAMAWDGDTSLNPGEGGFYHNSTATPFTITFVGEVLQGSLTNPIPINAFAIRSSMVPQSGGVSTVLGFPAEDGDQIYVYNGGYTTSTYDGLAAAWDVEPTPAVGQAFFTHKASTSTINQWVRNFTVQ
jgi:hypothetical protein